MTGPGQLPAKQPVSALLAGPYGHPFHPVLVTIPIGAWVSSVVLDIGARVTDHTAALDLNVSRAYLDARVLALGL